MFIAEFRIGETYSRVGTAPLVTGADDSLPNTVWDPFMIEAPVFGDSLFNDGPGFFAVSVPSRGRITISNHWEGAETVAAGDFVKVWQLRSAGRFRRFPIDWVVVYQGQVAVVEQGADTVVLTLRGADLSALLSPNVYAGTNTTDRGREGHPDSSIKGTAKPVALGACFPGEWIEPVEVNQFGLIYQVHDGPIGGAWQVGERLQDGTIEYWPEARESGVAVGDLTESAFDAFTWTNPGTVTEYITCNEVGCIRLSQRPVGVLLTRFNGNFAGYGTATHASVVGAILVRSGVDYVIGDDLIADTAIAGYWSRSGETCMDALAKLLPGCGAFLVEIEPTTEGVPRILVDKWTVGYGSVVELDNQRIGRWTMRVIPAIRGLVFTYGRFAELDSVPAVSVGGLGSPQGDDPSADPAGQYTNPTVFKQRDDRSDVPPGNDDPTNPVPTAIQVSAGDTSGSPVVVQTYYMDAPGAQAECDRQFALASVTGRYWELPYYTATIPDLAVGDRVVFDGYDAVILGVKQLRNGTATAYLRSVT